MDYFDKTYKKEYVAELRRKFVKEAVEAIGHESVSDETVETIIAEERYISVEGENYNEIFDEAKSKGIDISKTSDYRDAIAMDNYYLWICKSIYADFKNGDYYVDGKRANGVFIKAGKVVDDL